MPRAGESSPRLYTPLFLFLKLVLVHNAHSPYTCSPVPNCATQKLFECILDIFSTFDIVFFEELTDDVPLFLFPSVICSL